MKRRVAGAACVAALLSGCATTPYTAKMPEHLTVYGQDLNGPAVVRFITPGSQAGRVVKVGDRISAVNGQPVKTIGAFYKALGTKTDNTAITFKTKTGHTRTVPLQELAAKKYSLNILPVVPGQALITQEKDLYRREQDAGMFVCGHILGTARASLWPTEPRYVEVHISMRAPPTCRDCSLKNIVLEDWSAKSFLNAVPVAGVASAVFPQAGETPPAPMPVPAPTVAGYVGNSSTFGTLSGSSYGNSYSGMYSGTTTTTVTPYYNYSATNFAEGYNLGVAIRAARIRQAKAAIRKFVVDRTGNMRLGAMNPGELMTGDVFFAVPNNMNGPFVLAVVGGKKKIGVVRFDIPSE